MEKQFSVNIPDELYVNSWEQNLTATFTYSGPEFIYAIISLIKHQDPDQPTQEVFSRVSFEAVQDPVLLNQDNYKILTISANDQPALAELFFQLNNTGYQYSYVDHVNYDNSVAAVISNPRITDYYSFVYEIDVDTGEYKFKLIPIYKEPNNLSIISTINNKLELLKYNRDSVTNTPQMLTSINAAITQLEQFKETVKNQRPWHFDVLPTDDAIPKISRALEMSLQKIPPTPPATEEVPV